MTAWRRIEVDKLPDIAECKSHTTYLVNGVDWVPNNMFLLGDPTHWITSDEFWSFLDEEDEEYEL